MLLGETKKTLSRIAIATAMGLATGSFAIKGGPAKAADLSGDCCADLEERVAELEATTVRKGNKKVAVTLSGWVIKLGTWWDDGHETNLYWGDKETTLSSHFTISGQATIAPGWSAGYNLTVEMPGNSASVGFVENQFNDNTWLWGSLTGATINTPISYMWVKSDRYGTVNWGLLSQATDNVALLPDLSGTVIESNAVVFEGAGMFVRPRGAKNASDIATGDFTWGSVLTCLGLGGPTGADCNGYPYNGVRYDTPTWAGFSASGGWYEDDVWDIAVKYAANWNSVKLSAAFGFAQITDEGCGFSGTGCTNVPFLGGGGAPFQGFRKDADVFQVGASVLHVPSGLWVYGYYQHEDNNGTQFQTLDVNAGTLVNDSNANSTDVWFAKAGIRRTWTHLGATVIWGEGGQYFDMFGSILGLCPGLVCVSAVPSGQTSANGVNINNIVAVTGSTVNRWGAGIVQEIDAAAMHVFFRWQHLNVGLDERCADPVVGCLSGNQIVPLGSKVRDRFDDLDILQGGGVIFF